MQVSLMIILFNRWLRSVAMWLVWNVPLGAAAPHVFGFAMGAEHRKVEDD